MTAFDRLIARLADARRHERELGEDRIRLEERIQAAIVRRSELEDLVDAFKEEREQ